MKKKVDKWLVPKANLNLDNFRYKPGGTVSLVDALCSFLKEEIVFGRIKGGEKFPTISEIGKASGLSFAQARRVTECLAKSGVSHIFAYGDKPVVDDRSPWIEFSMKTANSLFAEHCAKVGVRRVLQVVYEDNESKGRIPSPPVISPQYVFGATFPF